MRSVIKFLAVITFCLSNTASAVDIITAFAGTGKPGDAGDGGPALAAQFVNPRGMAFDAAGNLYIVDENAARIRKVSRAGIVTTIAGDGTPGFAGDGGPALAAKLRDPRGLAIDSAGNLYFADNGNFRIRRIDTTGNISTIAGNGVQGSFPDGPALAMGLVNNIQSLAVAPTG
jgi:trimeric autotransporter adhesin